MAATSSYKTFLMKASSSSSTTYEKLCDIKSFPNLGGAPEMLDATTLSDKMRVYVAGIQELENMEFTANYDPDTYSTLEALSGEQNKYAVWFGGTESSGVVTPTGANGKFSFTADLSVYVNGKGVNEVNEMTITLIPSTVITFAAS